MIWCYFAFSGSWKLQNNHPKSYKRTVQIERYLRIWDYLFIKTWATDDTRKIAADVQDLYCPAGLKEQTCCWTSLCTLHTTLPIHPPAFPANFLVTVQEDKVCTTHCRFAVVFLDLPPVGLGRLLDLLLCCRCRQELCTSWLTIEIEIWCPDTAHKAIGFSLFMGNSFSFRSWLPPRHKKNIKNITWHDLTDLTK